MGLEIRQEDNAEFMKAILSCAFVDKMNSQS